MALPGFPRQAASGILSYFTRHRTAANLLMVVMLVLGVIAGTRIRSQFFPDVVIETVTVTVVWPGASPEDVDNAVVQLLEPPLLAVEGVESTQSTSREGRAIIRLDFSPGQDMTQAEKNVKAAVDSVTGLPDDAEDPVIRRAQWRDRVTDVVITGPVSVAQLARFADSFKTALFRAGVTRVTIRGVQAPETVVEVDQAALARNDVTMRQVAAAIGAEVATAPAGEVASGTARVRTGSPRRGVDEIGDIVIRTQADGAKLRVRDVARLSVNGVSRQRSYFVGDNPAISIRVDRTARGDAISIQKTVEKVARELESRLPAGVTVRLVRARAENISDRLNMLMDNGIVGLGLVLLLLFLFLDVRTAFWVAAGIPVSVAATIALMYAAGLTINMVSLFALIITLGIIVDDAIVVGEHADFRARRLGEPPVEAAENAARRMAAPVISATLTTIMAFLALTAIRGRFGTLIADIPFTVIAVLTASLIECFLVLPHHMSRALRGARRRRWYDWPSHNFNRGFAWFREVVFKRLMRLVILLRYPVVAGVIALLAWQLSLFVRGQVTWRFFSGPERATISANFAMVEGASRDDSLAFMHEIQNAARKLGKEYADRYGRDPVKFILGQVGGGAGRGLAVAQTRDRDLLGGVSIQLIDGDLRPYSTFRFLSDLKSLIRRPPMLDVLSFRGGHSGPGGDAIDIQLFGSSAATLKKASVAVKAALARFPEVSAVEDDLTYDKQELVLDLTARGRALGFTVEGLSRALRDRLNGIKAASYPLGTRSADITVRLPEPMTRADFLERMIMRSPGGAQVPLGDIVTVSRKAGFASVLREDGLRVLTITGDISGDDAARASAITAALRDDILPLVESQYGVGWRMAGLSEQENAFLADAELGFLLALIGIYLILAWIFSSWTRPVIVMAIIPFGLVGTIYGHDAWNVPLSMFTVVGLIGMSGIIINDSIVLVGTVDEYAQRRDITSAIVDGTADRLRPVLLTTLTTVLGLAPLLFETSRQAQFLKPTVITLSYGLGFGLVLVLLLVPALLAIQRDLSLRSNALRRLLLGGHHPGAARLLALLALSLVLAGFVTTVGWYAATGDIMPALALRLAAPPWLPTGVLALGLFVGASAVILVLAWLVALAGRPLMRRRARRG